jgi:hypothetical protein
MLALVLNVARYPRRAYGEVVRQGGLARIPIPGTPTSVIGAVSRTVLKRMLFLA